jgi:hypothetical protein
MFSEHKYEFSNSNKNFKNWNRKSDNQISIFRSQIWNFKFE